MMRALALPALAALLAVAAGAPAADDAPGADAVREAITLLEARLAQADNPDAKARIAGAIAGLEKGLPRKGAPAAKGGGDLDKVITPAALKRKLAGRATFNPKTGELTLVYDFLNKDQLRDFDPGDWKPRVSRGLVLQAGESVRHVATFDTCRVTCSLATPQPNGEFVRVGEAAIAIDNDGSSRHLRVGGERLTQQTGTGADFRGVWSADLSVEAKKVTAKFGVTTLGKPAAGSPGSLHLSGGNGGATFGKVTLTGVVDAGWARTSFAD